MRITRKAVTLKEYKKECKRKEIMEQIEFDKWKMQHTIVQNGTRRL